MNKALLVALIPELGKAKDDETGGCKQHGIKQDESTDGKVGVIAQDQDGCKSACRERHAQFLRSIVGEWDHDSAKESIEDTHESIIDIRVCCARFESKGAIVTSQSSRESNKHLSQGWMHIKVKVALDVIGAELDNMKQWR
jgi:hypothetical protein